MSRPFVTLTNGTRVSYCVLIPSRSRADMLTKSLAKMPWLAERVVLGIENKEREAYAHVLNAHQCQVLLYDNPTGSVAVAREQLRQLAVNVRYDWYVVTDDNATHPSLTALENLVRCAAEYPHQPVIMAGMHNTAIHFDRGKIKYAETHHGLRSYPTVAMIFQTYPHDVYAAYEYPPDSYGLDDRHFFLWCMARGIRQFRACMDAPFTKSRYQKGGQGTIAERMEKTGKAIARLASDFPSLVGAVGTLRIPWQFLLKMQDGTVTADRLVGGAMRREDALVRPTVRVRRSRRLSSPR